ncbi:MAG: hypothetical protein ACRDBG_02645 [Waterburya sp.]
MKPEHLELKNDLLAAIANKEHHSQKHYVCGTSRCIAGDKVLRDFPELIHEINSGKLMGSDDQIDETQYRHEVAEAWYFPWEYAKKAYSISESFSELVFDTESTYLHHIIAIDQIELEAFQYFDECEFGENYLDETPIALLAEEEDQYNYEWDGKTLTRKKNGEADFVIYEKPGKND